MSGTSSTGSGPPPPPRTKRPPHLAAAGGPGGDSMTIQPRGPLMQMQQQTSNKMHMQHSTEGLLADHLAPIAGSGVNAVRQRTPTYHELSATPNIHIGRGKNNVDSIRPISPSSLTTGVPETVIGEYVNVKGELAFDRLLRIDGCFEGKLVSDGDLIVGPQGKLIGDVVNIRSVLVEGHLIGNLIVESVALKGDAYVHGDITCKSMVMDGTAKLVGRVNVHPGAPKEMDAEGNLIYVRAQSTVSREAIPANHVETDAPESKIKGEFHFPKSKEDEQNVILSASESKKSITSDIQVQNAIADGASAQQEQEVTGENGSSTDGQVGELQREINEARDKAAQNRESEELELSSLRAEVERLKAEDKRLAEEARQRREALATEAAQLQSQVTAAASAAEVVGAEEAEGNKPAEEAES